MSQVHREEVLHHWIFNKIDRYQKSFVRMENAYNTCGRDGSAGDFPGDKLFDFE